jgi:hypothetical protein
LGGSTRAAGPSSRSRGARSGGRPAAPPAVTSLRAAVAVAATRRDGGLYLALLESRASSSSEPRTLREPWRPARARGGGGGGLRYLFPGDVPPPCGGGTSRRGIPARRQSRARGGGGGGGGGHRTAAGPGRARRRRRSPARTAARARPARPPSAPAAAAAAAAGSGGTVWPSARPQALGPQVCGPAA